MITVAGRIQKPNALGIYPSQDAGGYYTRACIEFADALGWRRDEVCTHWSQIALAVEMEGGRPRHAAEDLAWRHIQAALRDLRYAESD